jgi:hypothetical protein
MGKNVLLPRVVGPLSNVTDFREFRIFRSLLKKARTRIRLVRVEMGYLTSSISPGRQVLLNHGSSGP